MSDFHRRHYERIADRIFRVRAVSEDREVVLRMALELAQLFANDNAMFQRTRFMRACGFDDHEWEGGN